MFVGPTGYGLDLPALTGEVTVRPPVRRGDIDALVGHAAAPGVIAVVDGTFHAYPAVGHAELRGALAAGWQVWGVSSMGAIRAAELRRLGMRGFGTIYSRYVDENIDDDEVALLHGAEPPYPPFSEPLVHIREFLAALACGGALSTSEESSIAAAMKNRWYADRTLPALRELLRTRTATRPADLTGLLAGFDRFRVKRIDLAQFLAVRPWV
jgi:hypothetical protein